MTYPEPRDLHTEEELIKVRNSLPVAKTGDPLQAYKHALSCRLRKIRERKLIPITKDQMKALVESAPENCPDCGKLMRFWATGLTMSVDHILAISNGGTNIDSNLRICCNSCNSRKGNR